MLFKITGQLIIDNSELKLICGHSRCQAKIINPSIIQIGEMAFDMKGKCTGRCNIGHTDKNY